MTQKNVPEGHKNQIYETGKKRPDQQKDKKNKSTRKTQKIYQKNAKNLPERHKSHDQPVTHKKRRYLPETKKTRSA